MSVRNGTAGWWVKGVEKKSSKPPKSEGKVEPTCLDKLIVVIIERQKCDGVLYFVVFMV